MAEAMCAGFGLSRAELYRLFAPTGGGADATPARIAAVAQASGFGSERSLRDAPQELYGSSPRDLLRGQGAAPVGADAPDPAIGRLFDGL